MSKKVVCFGEVMLRLSAPGATRLVQAHHFEAWYAGSEANVAVGLSCLGSSAALATALPDNDLGRAALGSIRQHGVDTSEVVFAPGRLGIFFIENSASLRSGNIIYDRDGSSFASLDAGTIPWDQTFSGADWLHWSGISPAVSKKALACTLEALKAAKGKGLKISADFNYRSKLWQYGQKPGDVMPELLSYCDVVYGDIDTAEIYFGIQPDRTLSKMEMLQQCAEELQLRLPQASVIAMTFRESDHHASRYSGMLLTDRAYWSTSYPLTNVVERIGSGDAFMAGLIHALKSELPYQEVIEFAVSAGALKHSVTGDFGLFSVDEVRTLIKNGSTPGKINR